MERIKSIGNRILIIILLSLVILVLLAGCGTKENITFMAEIESVSENNILVNTIDFETFDKASVDISGAEYDFELTDGQIIDVTILPEIRESYPVQVTGVKLTLLEEAVGKVADYFPIKENTKYIYEGYGNEFASFQVFTDYASENKVQKRVDNGGSVLVNVYEISDEKLVRKFFRGETYYRENFLEEQDEEQEILLMEPLKKGTSWKLLDGRQRSITGVNTEVETPMGKFKTVEVSTEGNDSITIDYYAKDIGLVKTIFQTEGMEVSSSLKSIEENSSNIQSVQFYYPDESGKIYYKTKQVPFRTNDRTANILEKAYKESVGETSGVVLTTNAAIKSLALDDGNKVRLDLNSDFLTEMNAGAAFETAILQCIANTFCHYYDAEELILTIEGKPYESGHIIMQENEAIRANYEGVFEKE
ncbi:MAG: GerMN domain-containing protein [Anaerovoracaceae bacterium]|jgi:hypothetical protein